MLSSILLLLLVRADPTPSPFERYVPHVGEWHPYVSVGAGFQYNVPLPLVIRQSGHPDLRLTARFDTRPFAEVPYYDVKVGMERRPWAFELELVHHKLYLVNRPAEVGTFEITYGYNPILLNVVREQRNVALRAGAGIVLTHPETTVRGHRFPETGGVLGWYVSGRRRRSGSANGGNPASAGSEASRASWSACGRGFRLLTAARTCRTCRCTGCCQPAGGSSRFL
jgi:hypothetical protein